PAPIRPPSLHDALPISRVAVGSLAPEEMPIFDAVSQRCVANPERGLRMGQTSDDILGFGIDVLVPLLTPAAVAVAAEVLRILAQDRKSTRLNSSHRTIS